MKYGKIVLSIVSMLAAVPAVSAQANELDAPAGVPQGLIVRVDAQGKREVFKAELQAKVSSEQEAASAAASFATDANRVAQVTPGSELDRTTSTEAWCYWYAPAYTGSYYYSYSWYSYSWNYYPTYSWYGYGYQYYYYYGYRF